MTDQPDWEFVANLGDVNPLDYGGYFVYRDKTGRYDPQAEYLTDTDDGDGYHWLYRFDLPRMKMALDDEGNSHLVPVIYESSWPHPVSAYREWWVDSLADVASYVGSTTEELVKAVMSEEIIDRAMFYRGVGEYDGFDNLDHYPLRLSPDEARERYPQFV